MIERLIAMSIRHRVVVIALATMLTGAGIWATLETPVDAIPDLSETQVIVFSDWAGHTPREIEQQLTYPLAVQLQGIAGVRVVRSSSDFNFSMIHVIFEDQIDILTARRNVSEKLASIKLELPRGAATYLAPEAPSTGQIFWYVLEGRGYDLGRLRALQDWHIKHQLASVPGVAEVASVGGFPTEYRITLEPRKLALSGITVGHVIRELGAAHFELGGSVLQSPTAEYLIQVTSADADDKNVDPALTAQRLEDLLVPVGEEAVRLGEIADVAAAAGPRRGVLEQEGNEVVGGVVLMRYGENPLRVIKRLREKIIDLQPSLPPGVRIVTSYDRTPLIHAAVGTVSKALLEAIVVATLCVILVMRHFRTSLVISLTLPLSVFASFLTMWLLRALGIIDIQANIMSLAGLVISIGVLVDSAIVMAENVMHTLHRQYGQRPVVGDVRSVILPACQTVGRPIFFSVLIMLLSFLPVFALSGLEGKMFKPLAFTKSFALASSAILAITVVPALCSFMVKGRMRGERESWLVRSLIDAYRPILNYLLERPAAIFWVMTATFLVGLAPLGPWPRGLADWMGPASALGARPFMLIALVTGLVLVTYFARTRATAVAMFVSLVAVALAAQLVIQPLENQSLAPFDEQVVMDMPITVPRASVSEAADDLKARNMLLCRFPEVDMVMGKAGRADTPTDPAPIEMIETMVSFRPQRFWPQRKLSLSSTTELLTEIQGHLRSSRSVSDRSVVIDEQIARDVLDRFDVLMREYAYHRNQQHIRSSTRELAVLLVRELGDQWRQQGELKQQLSDGNVAGIVAALPTDALRQMALNPALERIDEVARLARSEAQRLKLFSTKKQTNAGFQFDFAIFNSDSTSQIQRQAARHHEKLWREHTRQVNRELASRAPGTFARLALEQLLAKSKIAKPKLHSEIQKLTAYRKQRPKLTASSHHHGSSVGKPDLGPLPLLDALQQRVTKIITPLPLYRNERSQLIGVDGEMDRALKMPGWGNVWTMPIQNRVDMLATGVNRPVGIRVLGSDLDEVVATSEKVAEVVGQIPGAAGVIADPIRSKGYLSIRIDPQRAAENGVALSDANEMLSVALGGVPAATIVQGRQRHTVRVVLPANLRSDVDAIRRLPIRSRRFGPSSNDSHQVSSDLTNGMTRSNSDIQWVTLGQIADVNIEQGPSTIKGENGLLRNYVYLDVRQRDVLDFVNEAKRVVAEKVKFPTGVYAEWTGQFEHQQKARNTLAVVLPIVIGLILIILYWTYRDLSDALLMLLAVPGAIAGGLLAQWIFGYEFSVTVAVGYIACFGMATSTGIIMLVYLREAVERSGGLENMSLLQLRAAVLDGAVHRLRPKLLTEATTIIGLAPMLWATGVGAEVIRPMAVPVLGGILIADEVIDLFLPVMFYWVRRRRWQKLHALNRSESNSPEAEELVPSIAGN